MENVTMPDINQRTLSRTVCNIMRGKNRALADYIICVAQGDKLLWTHDEAKQLETELNNCSLSLGSFLALYHVGDLKA